MERKGEKADAEESACSGARSVGRLGPQRGEAAGQQRKWSQGRLGQKSQEENRRPSQRATSAPRSPEKLIEIVIRVDLRAVRRLCHWSGTLRHPFRWRPVAERLKLNQFRVFSLRWGFFNEVV
jgi:hypothetical protein